MKILVFIFTLFIFFQNNPEAPESLVFVHPLHLSTTDAVLNVNDSRFEITCRLFSDDFENALKNSATQKIDLGMKEMHASMDALVKTYMTANLHLRTGGKPLALHYLGYQINKEATEVFIESDQANAFKTVEVQNSLLYNIFTDEINIVHITIAGVRKSGKLDYPATSITQAF